jgi:hypothetical protein
LGLELSVRGRSDDEDTTYEGRIGMDWLGGRERTYISVSIEHRF